MEMESLRKLRLLLEDFPKNHNLILVGQVELLSNLDLQVNQDIKSRVTYSVITKRLHDDAMREFIHREFDRIGLGHNTSQPASHRTGGVRSCEGVLRRCRNLCLSAMLEACVLRLVATLISTSSIACFFNRIAERSDLTDF